MRMCLAMTETKETQAPRRVVLIVASERNQKFQVSTSFACQQLNRSFFFSISLSEKGEGQREELSFTFKLCCHSDLRLLSNYLDPLLPTGSKELNFHDHI